MKTAILTILISLSFTCYSQDCIAIDKIDNFRGIKFGKPLPDSLKSLFRLKDTLSGGVGYKSQFSNTRFSPNQIPLFVFVDTFDIVRLSISNSGIIYSYELMKFKKIKKSIVLSKSNKTQLYEELLSELIIVFGEPEFPTTFNKYKDGNQLYTAWSCENIEITLNLVQDSPTSIAYFIMINSRKVEKEEKRKQYIKQ